MATVKKKKNVEKKVKVVTKPKSKEEKEVVCLTCIRGNRKAVIQGNTCLTCKRMNRKQELIDG